MSVLTLSRHSAFPDEPPKDETGIQVLVHAAKGRNP